MEKKKSRVDLNMLLSLLRTIYKFIHVCHSVNVHSDRTVYWSVRLHFWLKFTVLSN